MFGEQKPDCGTAVDLMDYLAQGLYYSWPLFSSPLFVCWRQRDEKNPSLGARARGAQASHELEAEPSSRMTMMWYHLPPRCKSRLFGPRPESAYQQQPRELWVSHEPRGWTTSRRRPRIRAKHCGYWFRSAKGVDGCEFPALEPEPVISFTSC